MLISDYQPKKRYKAAGEFDTENCVMYFDLSTVEITEFRVPKQ